MRLRTILLLLSLLTFFSASAAGYLYYASSRQSALAEADRHAALAAGTIRDRVSSHLNEYLKSAKAIAGLQEIRTVLKQFHERSLRQANSTLDHFRSALDVDVCYLMDGQGNTIASSNRNDADSFVGENYSFRPYYREAVKGAPAVYMARGVTSHKRGVYYSHPVYGNPQEPPIGVLVIKASISLMEREFLQAREGIASLVDPGGLVFMSNRTDWIFHFLWKPSPEDLMSIGLSRQFGEGPFHWTGMDRESDQIVRDAAGNEYALYVTSVQNTPGWKVVYLQSTQAVSKRVSLRLIKIMGFATLVFCTLIGLFVFFLYRKASYHISQRRAAEAALRESEETALALLNAPTEGALLLDTKGVILALNNPAAERFGRSAEELIGKCAFDLFPPEVGENRKLHHAQAIRSGKPVRYEDAREGRCLNTNVYPVFDSKGGVVRVAVFSRDVTEQKQAESALKLAKEELTLHSEELERRVKERTEEISGILKFTPAVVYIKDREGCYTLVNSKFEQIFGITNEAIQGKKDREVFPKETADRLAVGDRKVLKEGVFFQGEEPISREDGVHTYLSVKFPLYDDRGTVHGLCGIATDVTVLKKAEDQLRRLSASIMSSQEKERSAIARELHDQLGQLLTALRFESVWLMEHLKGHDPKAAKRAKSMCDLIDSTIDEVRGISIRLRPGVLDDLGLLAALEWYTADFEKRTGIECSFLHSGVDRVGDILSTAAYRITQEALTNVARHSRASHVTVALERVNGSVSLSVKDDGKGFNTEAVSQLDCLGIAGMRERASLVGGALEIRSHPGGGTEVVLRVPPSCAEEVLH